MNQKIICALCQCAGENRVTGPLSSKNSVTAHENCLLFSSGLYCHNSPVDDSLCGFSVDDVKKEIRRGYRLSCHRCNVKGATVGCEVKQCKRTYHYPCARKDGADIIEDRLKGTYKVYCQKHGANTESSTGKVPLCRELLFDGDDDAKAGPSGGHDSDTSRHHNHMSPKMPGSFKEENKMPQQQSQWRLKRKRRTLVIESDSGEDEHMVDLECAPLESDLDSSVTWQDKVTTPPQDPPSKDADSAVASTSGHACPLKEGGGEDMSIDSDESESLLLPVTILPASQSTAAGSGHSPTFIPTSPLTCGPTQPSNSKGSPSTHTATFPSSPEGCQVPTSPPSSSTLFWKSCNQAGCTADIFNTFLSDMRDISSRILTDQASQEDYDVSLRVLEASGKLSFLVTENRKALERKQKEVQRSLAALKTASSVLKR